MSEFKTISEVAEQLDLPQHVLRFWETQFSQVKPVKRKGGRRFYASKDVEILEKIKNLLYVKGYTIKGAKKALNQHFLPGDNLLIQESEDMKKQKATAAATANQIDIFEVINRPTADEKTALQKILINLKEMEKLLKNSA